MIEIEGNISFSAAVEKFLLMDDDEHEQIIEQLDLLLSAAEYAFTLKDNRSIN